MSNTNNQNNDINKNVNDETIHRSRRNNKKSRKNPKKDHKLNLKIGKGEKAIDFSSIDKKKVLKIAIIAFLTVCLIGIVYVATVIISAPDIETDDIYSLLSQSSVLYDDKGEVMDTVFGNENRTLVEIDKFQ